MRTSCRLTKINKIPTARKMSSAYQHNIPICMSAEPKNSLLLTASNGSNSCKIIKNQLFGLQI